MYNYTHRFANSISKMIMDIFEIGEIAAEARRYGMRCETIRAGSSSAGMLTSRFTLSPSSSAITSDSVKARISGISRSPSNFRQIQN